MINDLKMFYRYFSGLYMYLRQPLTPEECRRRILRQLKERNNSFLRIVEQGKLDVLQVGDP